MSLRRSSRPHDDFVDVDVGRLFAGVGHRSGDASGFSAVG
jgi:hypothetical protein